MTRWLLALCLIVALAWVAVWVEQRAYERRQAAAEAVAGRDRTARPAPAAGAPASHRTPR